ncbi:MAG: cytidine deaminase [Halobacteriovoraceae bacterium]|nr:cytidine deaminase [Halobacteriovoraceae bacterium]MBC97792.1 cytidine deaminase [Halobacteriovoraceae bacterium]|tara:strand:- start:38385 stop:38813 length:429 start_codon:yes stop_codon:yes gene_type:complete
MAKHHIEVSALVEKSYDVAKKAQSHTHSPYSNFPVGACIKFIGDDQLYGGCNVENASYGATICAERTALVSAVAAKGKQNIEFLTVIANTKGATYPCALCLQVLAEFCDKDFPVYIANAEGILKQMSFRDFLPHSFDSLYDI